MSSPANVNIVDPNPQTKLEETEYMQDRLPLEIPPSKGREASTSPGLPNGSFKVCRVLEEVNVG